MPVVLVPVGVEREASERTGRNESYEDDHAVPKVLQHVAGCKRCRCQDYENEGELESVACSSFSLQALEKPHGEASQRADHEDGSYSNHNLVRW